LIKNSPYLLNPLKLPIIFHPTISYNVSVIAFFSSFVVIKNKIKSNCIAKVVIKIMAINRHDAYMPLQNHASATL
jgi:hypothetical protein